MKKLRVISLLLSALLVMQCGLISVFATSVEDTTPLESTEDSSAVTPVPDVTYGSAYINNGCRTINGQTPLGGNDRILQTARAAFVYEANTQTVIYSYNPDERIYPGTLSKLLVGLIVIENADLDREVVFSTRYNKGLIGTRLAELKEEEEVTIRDLLGCLMVASANDAARMLANTVAPNENAFVEMMNQRAKEIGCTDSHFTNCTGFDDPEQYTTARDMAKILTAAYKNPTFREFFGMDGYTLGPNNRREKAEVFETDNHLMYERVLAQFYDDTVKGGMASYSENAGAGLAFVSEDEGMSLVMIIMGGTRTHEPDRPWVVQYYGNFEEALDLLEFVYDGFYIRRLLYPGQTLSQFSVLNGESMVMGQSNVAIDSILPKNVHLNNLNFRFTVIDGGLTAPIEKGDQIATVQVWYRTSCITETEVYAMHDVASKQNSGLVIHSVASRSDQNMTDILLFLGISCLVIIVPLGLYIGINSARRAAHRARRRRRRASRRRSR